jgi:hypothetical protein
MNEVAIYLVCVGVILFTLGAALAWHELKQRF